ncbi:polyprenyl synthetase family protein [Streptomyces profundus]|uniref:polyprenyl synthetase family protein n=1 Tax=Streptomyces profundus TaxID=2867410 RepID=UPI001D1660CC|nr:polyprenyl synthetase family protein [Streptomyces sp. MA3_2.13]UED87032.1 polyprenyl synthetase family protein [Streptomyces sp. MA3_2.13]
MAVHQFRRDPLRSDSVPVQGWRVGSHAVLRKLYGGPRRRLRPAEREVEQRLRGGLEAVEEELRLAVTTDVDPRIAELASHIAAAGGKRLRPLLALLAAEFGDPAREGVVRAAAVVELVHIASLYHDDVMDATDTRRGVESANSRWGNQLAVRGGDWLLARAARLAADLGQHAVRHNSQAAVRLVEGQFRELLGPGPDEDPVDHYFEVIAGKTVELVAMSLRIGATQSAAPAEYTEVLSEYGANLGAAFQISDDLIDLMSPPGVSGKEQGRDLRIGVLSLPVLLARGDHSREGAELRSLLEEGPITDSRTHRSTLKLFHDSPAIARTRAMMHERVERARAGLASLPEIPARAALDAMCDFVADRTA